ncbi:hydroxyproline dehydrogenase, partial [Caerostris extrusa]
MEDKQNTPRAQWSVSPSSSDAPRPSLQDSATMRSVLFHSVRRIPFRSLSTPPPNFEDPGMVFQRKSTWEIVRALAVLRACSVNALVDNSLQLLRGMERVVGESGLRVLLKRTLYEQFVGGENPAELQGCMERVSCAGMRCMLAATMEEDVGEGGSERVYRENCRRILEVVDMSSKGCPSPMIQLKLSGLLPARLLVLVGDCYMEAKSKLQVAEAIGEGMAGRSVQMKPFEGRLNGEDQDSLRRAVGRFKDICESARQKGVRILVDAECTYLNEGLSALTLGAVAAFNSHVPVVWNTYQCYLKAADHRVRSEMGLIVKQLGAHFGAKMVRGAYMLQERQRALQSGLPSPVCDDYSATCINYDKIVSFPSAGWTGELGPRCQFIAATHNEHNSIRHSSSR